MSYFPDGKGANSHFADGDGAYRNSAHGHGSRRASAQRHGPGGKHSHGRRAYRQPAQRDEADCHDAFSYRAYGNNTLRAVESAAPYIYMYERQAKERAPALVLEVPAPVRARRRGGFPARLFPFLTALHARQLVQGDTEYPRKLYKLLQLGS